MYTFFFYTKLCKDFPRIGSFLLVSKAHEQTEQKTKKTTIYNRILKKKRIFYCVIKDLVNKTLNG